MKSKRLVAEIAVFLTLAFLQCTIPSAAWSQAAADLGRSTGNPTSIYHGTDLENVNTTSLNLRISLPLVHLPGRGLDTDVVLSYNSKIWNSVYTPPSDPQLLPSVAFPPLLTGMRGIGWTVGVPRMGFSDSGGDVCEMPNPTNPDACLLMISHGSWGQFDGTKTELVRRSDGATSIPASIDEMASFDGGFTYLSSRGIVYKDGVTVGAGPSLIDTNGNKISCSLASNGALAACTDTVGRQIVFNNDLATRGLPLSMSYLDSSGTSRTVSFQYAVFSFGYPFVPPPPTSCNYGPPTPVSALLLTGLTLANGLTYHFEYLINPDGTTTGEITKITLPTGGYIRYTYGFASISNDAYLNACGHVEIIGQDRVVTGRFVSPDGNSASEQAWTYTFLPDQIVDGQSCVVTKVTDPQGNSQTYAREPSTGLFHHIDYIDSSGSVMKTVKGLVEQGSGSGGSQDPYFYFQAINNPRYKTLTTILPGTNQQSQVTFTYGTYNNVTEKDETDWGIGAPGSVIRKTTYTYLHDSNPAYATNAVHILDRVTSETVCDAGNTFCSQTTMSYDTGTLTQTTNIIQHDYTNYSAANTLRGNPTQVSRFLNTTGGSVTTSNAYNDVGNLLQVTDPRSNVTTYSYADNYASGTPTQPTSAYRTLITLPTTNGVNHKERFQYYFNTGLTSASCGENFPSGTACVAGLNGQPDYKSLTYDLQGRPLMVTSGDGGQTTYTYNEAALPINIATSTKIDSTHNLAQTTVYDGLGRPSQTQLTYDPSGTDYQLTTYDSVGRKSRVYNPTRCNPPDTNCGEATWGYTSFTYDGLGRTTVVTAQDGGTTTSAFSGNTVTVTDPAGKMRRSVSDALGRLIEVDEPHIGSIPAQNNHVTLQSDGNFVLYNSANTALWASGTSGTGIGPVEVQDDGNLVLYQFKWQAGTYRPWNGAVIPYDSCRVSDSLFAGQTLFQGQCLENTTNTTFALMDNGNLEIYDRQLGQITFQSFTWGNTGARLVMQSDGNLVIYSVNNVALWASGTYGSGANVATLENDGRLILYSTIWNTGTSHGQVSGSLAHPACDIGYAIGMTGVMGTGQCLVSRNGHFELLLQTDGNMVLYDLAQNPAAAFWSTGTAVNAFSPGIGLQTLYSYDALGNLLCVEQHGDSATGTGCSAAPGNDATSPWRVRRFTYDSLGRLLTSSNPESNTVTPAPPASPFRVNTTYTYDVEGNLLQKTSPAPNQMGTATQTISYCYDSLHRMTGKAYSAQTCQNGQLPVGTAVVSFTYDQGTNGVGRMTGLTDQAGTGSYTYDLMGRISSETRVISGVSKSMSYDYNLDGSLKQLTYPSGRIVNYTYNGAARPITAIDANGTQYVSNVTHWPSGAEYQRWMPNIYFSTTLNNRLQISGLYSDNGQTASYYMNKTYSYGTQNNGNVMSIVNNKDPNRTATYTYDALNRITAGWSTANTGTLSWGENYTIDAWGNLMISPMGGKAHGGNFQCAGDNSNRATCLGYDASGNVTANGSTAYSYDQENRLLFTAGTNYVYDAEGNRVKKSSASTGTLYWYALPGIIAETDLTGTLKSEYVFFGGKRVARIDSPGNSVHYYLSDHLNSITMVVSAAGAPEEESDYTPFGTEYPVTGTGANHYKFTGKERDGETQLDYFGARYYSNGLGRFITPDWAAKATAVPYAQFADPQSLNLYTYVRNVPTSRADADGHCPNCPGDDPTLIPIMVYLVWRDNQFSTGDWRNPQNTNLVSNTVRISQSLNLDNTGDYGTQVNAVRHALWSSALTSKYGSGAARIVTDHHEKNPNVDLSVRTFSGKDAMANADQTVDLLNNRIGQAIGNANPDATATQSAGAVLDYYHTNGLFEAHKNEDGTVSVVQQKLSDADYKKAKSELKKMDENGRKKDQ